MEKFGKGFIAAETPDVARELVNVICGLGVDAIRSGERYEVTFSFSLDGQRKIEQFYELKVVRGLTTMTRAELDAKVQRHAESSDRMPRILFHPAFAALVIYCAVFVVVFGIYQFWETFIK